MRIVVADTGPLQYLILIDAIEILPGIFEAVLIPEIVQDELTHVRTPEKVRQWLALRPRWLELRATLPMSNLPFPQLGGGERSVIAVAQKERADLSLMDDREGVAVARAAGLAIMGTLGVLDLAARRGLIDLAEAFARLQKTNFRCRQNLFDEMLAEFSAVQSRS